MQNAGQSNQTETVAVTGLNHKGADISLRERFSISREAVHSSLSALTELPGVSEAVLISTCNRLEIVSSYGGASLSELPLGFAEFLEELSGLPHAEFGPSLYHLEGEQAIGHLFRVAAGLDSLVVGEPQILGQMKEAFRYAQEAGTASAVLSRLFSRAFGVAKSIRTHTNIGKNAVSVCYAARELAKHIFGDLEEASVMLLGAGEMGELSLKHFHAVPVREIFVVNKTVERAVTLGSHYGAIALSLENVGGLLEKPDIIIGASGVSAVESYLLTEQIVRRALKRRPGRAQFYLDLGVPRNFEPSIGELTDAYLYNIDDLKSTVETNLSKRNLEIGHAEVIIGEEVRKFSRWLESRAVDYTIREVVLRCDTFEQSEIEKTSRRLRRVVAEEQMPLVRAALADLAHALVAKTLHPPITALRRSVESKEEQNSLQRFRALFLSEDSGDDPLSDD